MPAKTIPVEVTNAEVAVGVAINSPPEEYHFTPPAFRNEVRILQEEVQEIGVEHVLSNELLAKLVAFDALAVLLTIVEVELEFPWVKLPLTTLLVFFHLPIIRKEGIGVEVDGVIDDLDLTAPELNLTNLSQKLGVLKQSIELRGSTIDFCPVVTHFRSEPDTEC